MKLFVNFLLFGSFVTLASVSAFLPLSLVRVASPAPGLSILGESTGPNSLKIGFEESEAGRIILLSGMAYPGQNTYYNTAFRLANPTAETQFYKLVVLKTYPLGKNLTVELNTAGGGQNVVLPPGASVPVNLRIASVDDNSSVPFKFTAKILTLNLN